MKKAIKYLLAMLLTAWTGALTIAVGLRVLVWIFELMDKASNNGAFAAAGLIGALVLLTVYGK